jgi:predicted site-specific integrase-resolvase
MNTESISYVPIEGLAKHLSVKVSTIRQWVNKGYIPKRTYIKVGYTYRFNIPQVVDALKKDVLKEDKPAVETLVAAENKPIQLELDFDDDL